MTSLKENFKVTSPKVYKSSQKNATLYERWKKIFFQRTYIHTFVAIPHLSNL